MLDQALLEVGSLYENGELTLGFFQRVTRNWEERAGLGRAWSEQAEVRLQGSTQGGSMRQLSGGPEDHPGRPGCFVQHRTLHWEGEAAQPPAVWP